MNIKETPQGNYQVDDKEFTNLREAVEHTGDSFTFTPHVKYDGR